MVALNESLNKKFGELLGLVDKGTFTVQTHTHYAGGGLDNQDAGNARLDLIVQGDALENDNALPRVLTSIISRVKVLGDNVQFESDRKHAENMAKHLVEFIAEGAVVQQSSVDWFKAQAVKDAKARPDHAFEIHKSDLGIQLHMDCGGADPSLIAKQMEDAKPSIVNMIIERTLKNPPYASQSEDEKKKVAEAIKGLDISIETHKNPHHSSLEINIRGKFQHDKVKSATDRWNVKLDGEEAKKARECNPLNWLADGDGKTPETPATLQKVLARAFLYEGKNPRDYFPQVAGAKDMQIAVTKALVNLKTQKPALAKKVDEFLNDEMFKEHDRWHGMYAHHIGDVESDDGHKGKPRIEKLTYDPASDNRKYVAGQVKIELPLPGIKYNAIMASLEHDITAAIEEIKKQKAGLQTPAAPATPAEQPAVTAAQPAAAVAHPPAVAGAAAGVACPPGQAAVAAAGAVGAGEHAAAAAGAACVTPPAPPEPTSLAGAIDQALAHVPSRTADSFLKAVGARPASATERALASRDTSRSMAP